MENRITTNEDTFILVEEFAKREKQVYPSSVTYRTYDKYRCTNCENEIFIRRDIKGKRKHCKCQNTFTGNERLYFIWRSMIQRCENEKHKSYENYGGRGISVDEDNWKNFKIFKKWSLENGYKDDLTIERIDVNGNYNKKNCTWATRYEQSINKRNNRLSKQDVDDIREMDKNGFSRKDIFEKYKGKVNHRTRIDTIVRGDAWKL